MKKVLSILLSMVIALSCVYSIGVNAFGACISIDDNESHSYTRGSLTYSYNKSTKTITITGKGAIANNTFSKRFDVYDHLDEKTGDISIYPICNDTYSYYGPNDTDATKLVIGEGITEIGAEAFNSYPNLQTVSLPSTVAKIGDYAFCYDSKLASINIPASCVEIGRGAFASTGISSISLPTGLEKIGAFAFANTSIKALNIPKTVNEICNIAYECDSLKTINILGNSSFHCVATKCPNLKQVVFYGFDARYYDAQCETYNGFDNSAKTEVAPKCSLLDGCDNATIYCEFESNVDAYCYEQEISHKLINIPDAVEDLKVTATSTSAATLAWSKSAFAKSYQVQKYDASNKKWQTIATVTTNKYTAKSLASGSDTKFRVRGIAPLDDTYLYGDFSKTVVATTNPATPAGVAVSSKSSKMNVSYKKSAGATGYEIAYAKGKNGKWTVKKVAGTSFSVKLTKKAKYNVKVRAYKTANGKTYRSAWSSTKSITIK